MTLSERVGTVVGRAVAPLFTTVSRGRGARTFHPRGDLARATVEAVRTGEAPLDVLGRSLVGGALLRFSNALWNNARWPDALGCALSFVDAKGYADQHLLFATIRRPWTMPFAPFTTLVGNYFANDYYAVSPFRAMGLTRFWLRLRPELRALEGARSQAERRELLQRWIDSGAASLLLEASRGPWGDYVPFARVTAKALLPSDPPGLAFDPFLNGRGLTPLGFVHALRHGAYAGSRSGRPGPPHEPAPVRRLPRTARR